MAISKQIAFILEAAHRAGIIHRDLKPDNIFLLDGGDLPRIKVLDFGVAKFRHNDLFLRTTKTGQMLGTPYYMSPEQCAGTGIDNRSDVYALGCVMYQMLTGRVPFAGNLIAVVTGHRRETPTPIAALNHTVPEPLIELIDQMMAKDIEQRPQSMAYVATALDMAAATPLPRSPTEVRSPSRSTPRMKLAETINSMGENQRRAVRLGYPLALLLVMVAAVSAWLSFGL
jgi:serine/threonine-protein kinase